MIRRFETLVIGVAGLALVAGCGGKTRSRGADSELCPAARACGGELVGSWEARTLCTDFGYVEALSPCAETLAVDAEPWVAGVHTYRADGTYTASTTYGGWVTLRVPATCAGAAGELDCTVLEAELLQRGRLFVRTTACQEVSQGCDCRLELAPFARESAGTFRVDGGELFDGDGLAGEYCVEGDALTLTLSGADELETLGLVRR